MLKRTSSSAPEAPLCMNFIILNTKTHHFKCTFHHFKYLSAIVLLQLPKFERGGSCGSTHPKPLKGPSVFIIKPTCFNRKSGFLNRKSGFVPLKTHLGACSRTPDCPTIPQFSSIFLNFPQLSSIFNRKDP